LILNLLGGAGDGPSPRRLWESGPPPGAPVLT